MNEYKYNGYTFRRTTTTTTTRIKNARGYYVERLSYLYEIDGLKEAGKRPFLTSVEQCREYIRDNTD